MGAFVVAVAAGLAAGASAAAPWLIYARRAIPNLARTGARPAAYAVAAIPAVLATAATFARLTGLTTGSLQADVTLIAVVIGVACTWPAIVQGALILTGGPLPGGPGVVDHPEAAAPEARATAVGMCAIVFLYTASWFVSPAYASLIACGDAEQILGNAQPPPANFAVLADAMPSGPPEPGAQYAFEYAMNLDQTATSRHDPHTREQLIRSGYVGGHVKVWLAADGRGIEADVMEFTAPEGATAYQAEVTRHACEYANEAFEAPLGGVGLQVRYETGDPIVEQVSWVAGNRRYLVMVSELAIPSDHQRILDIMDAATSSGWPR